VRSTGLSDRSSPPLESVKLNVALDPCSITECCRPSRKQRVCVISSARPRRGLLRKLIPQHLAPDCDHLRQRRIGNRRLLPALFDSPDCVTAEEHAQVSTQPASNMGSQAAIFGRQALASIRVKQFSTNRLYLASPMLAIAPLSRSRVTEGCDHAVPENASWHRRLVRLSLRHRAGPRMISFTADSLIVRLRRRWRRRNPHGTAEQSIAV